VQYYIPLSIIFVVVFIIECCSLCYVLNLQPLTVLEFIGKKRQVVELAATRNVSVYVARCIESFMLCGRSIPHERDSWHHSSKLCGIQITLHASFINIELPSSKARSLFLFSLSSVMNVDQVLDVVTAHCS
jgi:hypothetical protein